MLSLKDRMLELKKKPAYLQRMEYVENVDENDLSQSESEISDSQKIIIDYFGYSIFNNNPELFQQSS